MVMMRAGCQTAVTPNTFWMLSPSRHRLLASRICSYYEGLGGRGCAGNFPVLIAAPLDGEIAPLDIAKLAQALEEAAVIT
jgi:hypothetical protein